MTVTASIADLWNGTYVARIQDALGGAGASLTLNGSKPDSLTVRGTPTGEGLQILAKQQSAPGNPRTFNDTIALSPAAQVRLSEFQLAARLLENEDTPVADKKKTGTSAPAPADQHKIDPASDHTVDPTDVTQLANEKPAQVMRDVLTAAQSALDDPESFYQAAASNRGLIEFITLGLSDDSKTSFLTALKDQTLNIQNAASVPGWQHSSQVELTGTSESFSADASANGQSEFEQSQPSANFTSIDFGIGQLVISWPAASKST